MNNTTQWVLEPPAADHPFTITPHHTSISVPDIEASIDWYRRMLGFGVEMRFAFNHVPLKGAFLRRGTCRVEVFELPDAASLPPARREVESDLRTHGTKHMAFTVPDVRAALAYLKANGVEVAMEATDIDGTVAAFVRDNAGILLELVQGFPE